MVTVEVFESPQNDAAKALAKLRARMPDIDRKLRLMFAGQIVGHIQADYLRGQVLHRQTGDLAASVTYRDVSQNETMVGSYGVPYARIHELGGDIYPKRKPFLAWRQKTSVMTTYSSRGRRAKQNYGGWIFSRHVKIPKRPYLLPGILTYFESGRAEVEAEKFLQKELDKVERT